jgi:hypothetical protein
LYRGLAAKAKRRRDTRLRAELMATLRQPNNGAPAAAQPQK